MKTKIAFTYAGKDYKPGDDFDPEVLDPEDRNDIFLRRIGGVKNFEEKKPTVSEKHAEKEK